MGSENCGGRRCKKAFGIRAGKDRELEKLCTKYPIALCLSKERDCGLIRRGGMNYFGAQMRGRCNSGYFPAPKSCDSLRIILSHYFQVSNGGPQIEFS